MLDRADVKCLTDYFKPEDHEFLQGRAYIKEAAITTRIEEVDPSWSFAILSTEQRGDKIVVTASLSIKDVHRDNIGMAEIRTAKDGDRETNEPEKAAATDALKRCARLFGIGRYLLTLPPSVRDEITLGKWMDQHDTEPIVWPSHQAIEQLEIICKQQHLVECYEEMAMLADIQDPADWKKYPTGKAAYQAIKLAVSGGIEYEDIPL